MITITANARRATFKSDDLITSGSVGIPATFVLSDDFDGLSSIAVFEGSNTSVDVALMSNSCVVPPEVVTTAGGYLRIGVYARNSEGTIVIPTVWVSTQVILPGAEPSGVDPSQPTPDWTAQVQAAAAEALEIAQRVEDMGATAETLPAGSEATVEKAVDPDTGAITLSFGIPRGDRGEQGPQGETGPQGDPGEGVAPGGTTGQMLVKKTDADYDTEWVNPPQTVEIDPTLTVSGAAADAKATGDAILDLYPVATAGPSAIVSVDDAAPLEEEGLVAKIEPVQDLHGYDHPWPAGGSVNKLLFSNSDMSVTKNGITASYNATTGLFTVTGTETYGSAFAVLISENAFKLPNFVAGETYTISRTQVAGELSRNIYVQISYRRTSGTNQSLVLNDRASTTFTVPSDFDYAYNVFVGVYAGASNLNNAFKIQLESGSTVTDWTPYSNICPITGWTGCEVKHSGADVSDPTTLLVTFPSEAGTVYGGYVDLVNGKLVVDRAEVDLGTLNWMTPMDNRFYTTSLSSVIKKGTDGALWIQSSMFRTTSSLSDVYDSLDAIWLSTSGNISVSKMADTAAALKTAVTGQQLVYELATPITYDIDPATLTLLRGDNNVWADTGDTTLTYRQDVAILLSKLTAQVAALNSAVTNS